MVTDHARPLRVLWVYSELDPDPASGSQHYSESIARMLARRGHFVQVAGGARSAPPSGRGLEWRTIPFRRRSTLAALASFHPVLVARLPIRQMRQWLAGVLDEGWDLVVFNHLMSAWALGPSIAARNRGAVRAVVYASQNSEADVWRSSLTAGSLPLWERCARVMDYVKVARLERSVLRRVDAFTAITSGDLAVLSRKTPVRGVLATPPAPRQVLDRPTRPEFVDRPRRAVIVGSLMWRVKLGNLRSLLDVIATRLSDHGIEVVVAGTCADDDLHALRSDYPTVTFLGRVDDLGAVLDQGRVALLHEPAGGGFKMKIYDYISAGVPVVATSCSVADVQTSGGSMVHEVATTDELLAFVIAAIDDEVTLRRIRDDAHSAASVMGDGNAICESLEDLATVPTTQPRARR